MKLFCRSIKKRILNHDIYSAHDRNSETEFFEKELLKSAVINNLVQEEKRGITFSTQLPDENNNEEYQSNKNEENEFEDLKERIERLEIIVRKLVEYLVKGSLNTNVSTT